MSAAVLVIGAGISGATVARRLADAGRDVVVIDEARHVAGNCHTEIDPETGVLIHRFGPHIFHTDDDAVRDFLARFALFEPYRHRVFAVANGQFFRLPINLHTLSQFFGRVFTPDEARAHLESVASTGADADSFEARALELMGPDLYAAFFQGYTRKQWGCDPAELPSSILRRLPFRFDADDNYFHHTFQALPHKGYTHLIETMLNDDQIQLRLGLAAEAVGLEDFAHVFHSGAIDRHYKYQFGALSYRTLQFEDRAVDGDFQGTPVVNYCDQDIQHTRITEHRHLAPWRLYKGKGVISIETSHAAQPGDRLYYPVHRKVDLERLDLYCQLAEAEQNLTFVGRLGRYTYIDMDLACRQALDAADDYLDRNG